MGVPADGARRGRGLAALLYAAAIAALLISPWFGAKTISPLAIIEGSEAYSEIDARIFFQLRLSRVILAWCAGATFGVCGMVFQALFRNPLAEPSLLGVSAGASLGAAAAIKFGLVTAGATGIYAALSLPVCAFIGAMAAVGIITLFARMALGSRDATLLLAGVAIGALFSSVIMVFQYTSGANDTYRLVSWTLGGVAAVGLDEGLRGLIPAGLSVALAAARATELDLVLMGDVIASTRGVATERLRRLMFAGTSVAVALIVANCGPIGFIGLIAPHAARRAVGPRHLPLTFATAAAGGTAVVLCDMAARTLWAPADLPVGILISFLGAPFFIWLLFSSKSKI